MEVDVVADHSELAGGEQGPLGLGEREKGEDEGGEEEAVEHRRLNLDLIIGLANGKVLKGILILLICIFC